MQDEHLDNSPSGQRLRKVCATLLSTSSRLQRFSVLKSLKVDLGSLTIGCRANTYAWS